MKQSLRFDLLIVGLILASAAFAYHQCNAQPVPDTLELDPIVKLLEVEEDIPVVELPSLDTVDEDTTVVTDSTDDAEMGTDLVMPIVPIQGEKGGCTPWVNCNPNPPNFDGVCCRICGEPGSREWECVRTSVGESPLTDAEKEQLPFVNIGL